MLDSASKSRPLSRTPIEPKARHSPAEHIGCSPVFCAMVLPTAHLRVFRIHPRPDGGFEIRNEFPKDAPLGLADSFEQAMETSHREALDESRRGANVVIEALREGRWTEIERVIPPDAPDVGGGAEWRSQDEEVVVADHSYRCPRCNQVVDRNDLRDCLTHEVPGHERIAGTRPLE